MPRRRAPIFLRSTHMPLLRVASRTSANTEVRRDWGNALFFQENNDIRTKVRTFQLHTVTEVDEFAAPTISQKYYGTHEYWWILCLYNDLRDPTRELTAEKKIRIPDRVEVERYLSQTLGNRNRIGDFVAI